MRRSAGARGSALFALLSLLALAAVPACARVDADSDAETFVESQSSPIVRGTSAAEYTSAALLDMYVGGRLSSYCSGSIIAPKVILTAGHCVDGITSFKVKTPYAGNQSANASSKAALDWNNVSGDNVDPNLHDVGLVFLDTAITLSAYPSIHRAKLPNGTQAINVGRIQDNRLSSSGLFKGTAVSLRDATNDGFPFDYISNEIIQSGDSGGPVYLTGAAPHTIVAVNSGAGGGTQVLARLDLVADWIDRQVEAHGGYATGTGGSAGASGAAGTAGTSGSAGAAGTAGSAGTSGTGGGCPGTPESESNDAYTSPNAIDGTVCGALATGTDVDWYSYSAASSGVHYTLNLAGTGDQKLTLWKLADNAWVRVDNTTNTSFDKTSTSAGYYVVAVSSPAGTGTGAYSLTLTK
ncbi:MAG: trypsin-like serine protease [Polyangiaceae bacterium]